VLLRFNLGVSPAKRSAERESRGNVTAQRSGPGRLVPRTCGASGMTSLPPSPFANRVFSTAINLDALPIEVSVYESIGTMPHFKSIASVAFVASAFLAVQLVPSEAAARSKPRHSKPSHTKSSHVRKPVKKPVARHYAAPRRQPVYRAMPQQVYAPAPQQAVVSPYSPYGWLITVNAKTYVIPSLPFRRCRSAAPGNRCNGRRPTTASALPPSQAAHSTSVRW
jgi:hypothetical protein